MTGVYDPDRFRPAVVFAVVLAAVGVGAREPVAVFAAVIPLSVAAVGAVVADPPAESVAVSRTVSETQPVPGEDVRVETTVRNETERHLTDVRVVAGVPESVAVTDGSPRTHATLAPGEETTLTYTVHPPRESVTLAPPTVTIRSLAGVERRIEPDVTDEITARVDGEAVPLHGQTARIVGRVETDDPGEGVAFNSSRDYRPGDPVSRIDWNAFAANGELRTVSFDEERAATVVVVVDDRPSVRVVARAGEADAGERARTAARTLAEAMVAAGDSVGIALKGTVDSYLPPRGSGDAQALACRRLLAERGRVPDEVSTRAGEWHAEELADRLPAAAQIVFCTPLVDDDPVAAAELWMARGHPVTVVSPNPVAETPGGRVARLGRRERRDDLRRAGARVVDWDGTETLNVAVDHAEVAWE